MYYWRAAVKHEWETSYTIVYFATKQLDDVVDVADLLESYGLQTYNSYFRRLNKLEFISNALIYPIATTNTFQNYKHAILIS